MGCLQLPSLFSDAMILQRNAHVRIWGYDCSGRRVTVILLNQEKEQVSTTIVNQEGYWETWIDTKEESTECQLIIRDSEAEEYCIKNVCIGDVFICSGQSNMELPMERVKDQYPKEIENVYMPYVREFKILECCDFHNPVEELIGGNWKEAQVDTIRNFSATAYFFGKFLYENSNVPVGLINASYGGSRIQSWMSREMLADFKKDLDLIDTYSEDSFVKQQLDKNEQQMMEWHGDLDRRDIGLEEKWYKDQSYTKDWNTMVLPGFFENTPLQDFIGVVWFKKEIVIQGSMVGKKANLWLGTIVDSDMVYVNGTLIGSTEYQYPPRKYIIPEEILHEGVNSITIRVKCENGKGRFTPDKEYKLFTGEHHKIEKFIDLTGTWSYRIGAYTKKIPPTDFVNWQPTGLYNGIMAPCHRYAIKGMIWYQGEGNTDDPINYEALSFAMIRGYREKWNQGNFPYYYVQLPNFTIDLDEINSGWPELREEQERILKIENTGMACAIDLGEDNDLHPLNKKEVGERLSRLVCAKQYGMNMEYSGPTIEQIHVVSKEKQTEIIITCGHVNELLIKDRVSRKHRPIKELVDFQVAGNETVYETVQAKVEGNRIHLQWKKEERPRYLRYCHSNASKGALLYNEAGLPMAPFARTIE